MAPRDSLVLLKATRRRAKYVLTTLTGHWAVPWSGGTPVAEDSPQRWANMHHAVAEILAIVSTSRLWMEYVPVQRFIRALFASRLPPGVAYLFLAEAGCRDS